MKKDLNENLTDTFNGIPKSSDVDLDDPNIIFDDESFIDDILNDPEQIARAATLREACKIQLNPGY